MANAKVTAEALTLEKHVAGAIRERLQLAGWNVHRLTADRHAKGNNKAHEREEPGTPDYIAARWHKSLHWYQVAYIETKRSKGGKLRDSQIDWQAAAKAKNLLTFTFHSYEQFAREWPFDKI